MGSIRQDHRHFENLLLAAGQIAGLRAPFGGQHRESAGHTLDCCRVSRRRQRVAAHLQVFGDAS